MAADSLPGISIPAIRNSSISMRWPPLARRASKPTLRENRASNSRFVFGNVLAHDALVPLELPLVIRTMGEPLGNADLRMDHAGRHGDAGLITRGNDFLQAQLAVAENSDKSNEHGDLR